MAIIKDQRRLRISRFIDSLVLSTEDAALKSALITIKRGLFAQRLSTDLLDASVVVATKLGASRDQDYSAEIAFFNNLRASAQ